MNGSFRCHATMGEWNKIGRVFWDHHAQLPVVDVLVDRFRVYYSTRIHGKSMPRYVDLSLEDPRIILDKSKDLLELGKPGSFDWAGVMPTEIVTVGDVKYMYYIGWSVRSDVPYHNNLGLAFSNDQGLSWTKYSSGPIFHTSALEPGYVGTIGILREEGFWKGWYLSCRNWIDVDGVMEPVYDIKLAESCDGIVWKPTDITAIRLEGNEGGVSAARVLKIGGGYVMWFSVRGERDYRENPQNSYRIKCAVSLDGSTWRRQADEVLPLGKSGEWDSQMVCYPYVVQRTINKFYLFFNGNQFGGSGFGVAECDWP